MVTIVHSKSSWPPNDGERRNVLVIYDDNWNDYGYRTTFHVAYCDQDRKVHKIGGLKIYHYDLDEKRTETYHHAVSLLMPSEVVRLDDKFCSLGQSLSYYQNLKTYFPESYVEILERLNDIAVQPTLKEKFINEHGVQTSLLRESSAEKALNEADHLLETDRLKQKDMSFSYRVAVPYSETPVELAFNFTKDDDLPYRINILIGKNGTGKTQVLSQLANSLSGISDTAEDRGAMFIGKRPPIDKVISVSYSAFDSFKKRPAGEDEYYTNSYAYCGIQSENGTLSIEQLNQNFQKSFVLLKEKGREEAWKSVMSEVMEAEHSNLIEAVLNGRFDSVNFSSGQHVLICLITEALANIEKESLILFDEPEIHLHPNAIANTMRMLYKLLDEFDSYAIFATHSPLIVQETPSQYIQILDRINDVLSVRKPAMECFGENITGITNEIFDVCSTESNYKTVLSALAQKWSFDEVSELFGNNLSLNAMIFLKNCYRDKVID